MPTLAEQSRVRLFALAASKLFPPAVVFRMATEFAAENAFAALLYFIAGALFIVGLEIPAIAVADGSFTSAKFKIGLTIAAIGLAFFFAAQHAALVQGWLGPRFSKSVDTIVLDFRVWIAFAWTILAISAIWVVIAKSGDHDRLAGLASQTLALQRDFNRYVLPRHLTPEQISAIAGYLSKHDSQHIKLRTIWNDQEAGGYRGDFQTALTQGGWTIDGQDFVQDTPNSYVAQGLSIHTESPLSAPQPDPKHPTPDVLLREAFRHAHVQVDGTQSSGGSQAITMYSITLIVGRRRTDGYGYGSPQMVMKMVPEEMETP